MKNIRLEFLILGVLLILIITFYLNSVASQELEIAGKFIIMGLTALFGVFVLSLITLLFGYVFLRLRLFNHRATESLSDAQVKTMVVKEDENLFIRDTSEAATWTNTNLETRAEFGYSRPAADDNEQERWVFFHKFKFVSRVKGALSPKNDLLYEGDQSMLFPDEGQLALPKSNVLDMMLQAQRMLIVGASDTGKTTLLNHYIDRRLQAPNAEILVIDPHAEPTHWQNCKVIGRGSNHDEITQTLDKLVRIMERRYEEIGAGTVKTGMHPPITVIIDEWMSIAYMCDNATHTLIRLLTESRKAAFSVIIGTHSKRVKSLGLTGQGDLKEGFTIVQLKQIGIERTATVDLGDGNNIDVDLCGPYIDPYANVPILEDPNTQSAAAPVSMWDELLADDTLLLPSEKEQAAFESYLAGEKLRPITIALYDGDNKYGKHYNIKFARLCKRFEISLRPEDDWRYIQLKTDPYVAESESIAA